MSSLVPTREMTSQNAARIPADNALTGGIKCDDSNAVQHPKTNLLRHHILMHSIRRDGFATPTVQGHHAKGKPRRANS
jgi:hypothetical protein